MKRVVLVLILFASTISVTASQSYSERFISSFSACEPFTETTTITTPDGSKASLTKIVQGVMDHKCIYKQVIIRPTVRDITTCSLTKPMSQEIVEAMKSETGEKFNVNLDINGQTYPLMGITKSQIIWTQYLNADTVCKREIVER